MTKEEIKKFIEYIQDKTDPVYKSKVNKATERFLERLEKEQLQTETSKEKVTFGTVKADNLTSEFNVKFKDETLPTIKNDTSEKIAIENEFAITTQTKNSINITFKKTS